MPEDTFSFEEYWALSQVPATGRRAAAHRLAVAMRRVIDRLVQVAAPENDLNSAAEALERYADRLATFPASRSYEGFAETANAGDTHAFFDHSPLIGLANPLAPPIKLVVKDNKVIGHANFGVPYEGPPGHVHGGIVAASFDEVLGMTQSLTGNPGMTGTLTIRYRRPTPLLTDLVFEGFVDRVDGRKIFTHATLKSGETLTAEAEGLFISVGHERFQRMAEQLASSEKK
ncbi:MAG TPA: PaaI family thioesterase [Candidatus Binataceae bacterium]|nr:PaaI family thioesterase [Candidatus Binataceae bacterium]